MSGHVARVLHACIDQFIAETKSTFYIVAIEMINYTQHYIYYEMLDLYLHLYLIMHVHRLEIMNCYYYYNYTDH